MANIQVTNTITLTECEDLPIAEGTSPKLFFQHGDDHYIVKKPKKRTLAGIFSQSLPATLSDFKNWTYSDFKHHEENLSTSDKATLLPFFSHMRDLMIEAAFGEIIYMQIIKVMFPTQAEVPETYLHIDQQSGEPWVISKKINQFNEFIHDKLKKEMGRVLSSSSEWLVEKKLFRADLKFSDNELLLLGKLFCTALITHDWDLVNNIMLANSGCIGSTDTASKICVVDGGNKFHLGFDGFTCAESAFRNPDFKLNNAQDNYRYTLPFDVRVSPHLPRMIVSDLFKMDNPFILKGFNAMLVEVNDVLHNNPECIREAIAKSFSLTTKSSELQTIQRLTSTNSTLFNQSYYRKKHGYNLAGILVSRIRSCETLIERIKEGETEDQIHQEITENFCR